MKISDFLDKIKKRWWIMLILTLVFTLVFFSNLSQKTYFASVGLGTNFNNPEFVSGKADGPINGSEYTLGLKEFSTYLFNRLGSMEIQTKMLQKLNLDLAINEKKPFYNIVMQSGGYVSVSFEADTEEQAKNFLVAIKDLYAEIINTELNKGTPNKYQVSVKKDFVEAINQANKPQQLKLLPAIAGFLLGLFIILAFPKKWLLIKSEV